MKDLGINHPPPPLARPGWKAELERVIASENSQRQARLRPEYAELYPGLQPDAWFAASSVSELLIARARTRRGTRDFAQRSLNPRHFEFRGGSNDEPRRALRSRASDP